MRLKNGEKRRKLGGEMILKRFDDTVVVYREERIVYAEFLKPHRVISTCRVSGGIHDDMLYMYNHQSCEPANHHSMSHSIAARSPQGDKEMICGLHDLPHEKCVTLGTAANMRNAVFREASFKDLSVLAVCTGGVEGNAGRVGDPATVFEENGRFHQVGDIKPVLHGTINTMLFINRELTEGAMVRSIMTSTEAKSAVLQELAVGSKYSSGLATGTGTDQIGVACVMNTGTPLASAGKHSMLGELIGKAVHAAIKGTLALQNDLTPETQRSCLNHMIRFGLTRESMIERIQSRLNSEDADLFRDNFSVIDKDPLVVASVVSLIHLRDKIVWGILPESCIPEIFNHQGAYIAASVSGKYKRITYYMEKIKVLEPELERETFTNFINDLIAMGFEEKWVK